MLRTETVLRVLAVTALLLVASFLTSKSAYSAQATHVVISEVQISSSESSNHDFVELYNPTGEDVDLSDMRLVKRTSSGETDSNIVSFTEGDVIKAHGYFLWCNTSLTETDTPLVCDKNTSATVSNNNSIALREEPADEGVIVDAVSFGEVANSLGEGTPLTAPEDGTSVERKANPDSTSSSMAIGGSDEFMGNSEDTNDNAADFVSKSTPQPQNSSATETPTTPSTMPSMTPSATPTSTPTQSPEPTSTPSPTATPTNSPSPSPSVSPSASPSPTATPSASPTTTPTPSPTSTPDGQPVVFHSVSWHGGKLVCSVQYIKREYKFFTLYLPKISCSRTIL